jgi:predicted nucleotidyltransferase
VSEFDPERLLATLQEHGVEYVLVGALALAAHGVVRATLDVDMIPLPEQDNLDRLARAISGLDGEPHGEPDTPVTAELLGRDANMRFETAAGQLDVLAAEPYRRRYPELAARADRLAIGDVVAPVVSRDDLILLKAASGRERDLIDIGDLLALERE